MKDDELLEAIVLVEDFVLGGLERPIKLVVGTGTCRSWFRSSSRDPHVTCSILITVRIIVPVRPSLTSGSRRSLPLLLARFGWR